MDLLFGLGKKKVTVAANTSITALSTQKIDIGEVACQDVVMLEKIWGKGSTDGIVSKLRQAINERRREMEKVKSLLAVEQPVKEEEEKLSGLCRDIEQGLERTHRTLNRIVKALQAGYDNFAPNDQWYCGFAYESVDKVWPQESLLLQDRFPSRDRKKEKYSALVFKGNIPPHIQKAYLVAKEIFGEKHIQIYSPHIEDFKVINLYPDPVMVGMIENVPDCGNLFFRIAAWDIVKDIQEAI